MTDFKIIACINQKKAIGKEGRLLYHIKNDLLNFKKMTSYNGVVIMGRKTFESLPNGEPLKNRVNIILTSSEDFSVDGKFDNVYIVRSIDDVKELCEAFFADKEKFVIGGESLYRQFLDLGLVGEMRLTVVKDESDGDVFFPNFNEDEWYSYYKSMEQVKEGENTAFYFEVLKKK